MAFMTRPLREEARKVVVNTISYTGWKLVGVIPYSAFTYGMINMRYFIIMLMLLMAMMLAVVNRIVSVGISRPILKLNDSVKEYEAGRETGDLHRRAAGDPASGSVHPEIL